MDNLGPAQTSVASESARNAAGSSTSAHSEPTTAERLSSAHLPNQLNNRVANAERVQHRQGSDHARALPPRLIHGGSTQTIAHASLGNRISTFFGQHRTGSSETHPRPITSQGLARHTESSLKEDQAGKRKIFRIHQNKPHRHPSGQITPQVHSKPASLAGSESSDRLHSSERNHVYAPLAQGSSQVVGHQSTRVIASPISQNQRTYPSAPGETENGVVITRHGEIGEMYGDGYSRRADPISVTSSMSSISPGYKSDNIESSDNTATSILRSDPFNDASEELNCLKGHSSSIVKTHPESKEDLAQRFTWEINPSLSQGQELMGFGGDLGKKRLHIGGDCKRGIPTSGTSGDLEGGQPIPYIIGFEKQVLALLVLLPLSIPERY